MNQTQGINLTEDSSHDARIEAIKAGIKLLKRKPGFHFKVFKYDSSKADCSSSCVDAGRELRLGLTACGLRDITGIGINGAPIGEEFYNALNDNPYVVEGCLRRER